MKATSVRVPCYNCGRSGDRALPACAACHATFRALCPCGSELSVYDDHCASCDAPHVPRRLPAARRPLVRALKWTALASAAAFAAWVAFAPRPVPNWRLKTEAQEAIAAGDFETAARKVRTVTESGSGDPAAWHLLAVAYRGLGFPPEQCIDAAKQALVLDPRHLPTLLLLADLEARAGRPDLALEFAELAARTPGADGRVWQEVARLELRKPRPDLARVETALAEARGRGRDTLEVKVLLADVTVRLNGPLGGGPGRLQPQVAATFRSALSALADAPPRAITPAASAACRARLHLALGEANEAYAAASGALHAADFDAAAPEAGELRLYAAMALHARGSTAEAMAGFGDLLRERPDTATAAAVTSYLLSAGDAAGASLLVATAAQANDPRGDLTAVLAVLRLGAGDVEGALAAIEAARAKTRDDAFFAEIEGEARLAAGRLDDARLSFDDAVRIAPELVGPRVRRALGVLAVPGGPPPEALAAAIADLDDQRRRFGDDPFLLAGLGRLRLARGDGAGAVELLEIAARGAPSDADTWILLAAAAARSGGANGLTRAAAALSRARLLRRDDARLARDETTAWLIAGKPEAAVSAATDHLRTHPDEPIVLRVRAKAYVQLGLASLGAQDYQRLAGLKDATDDDVLGLVDALAKAGDRDGVRRATAAARGRASPYVDAHLDIRAAMDAGEDARALELIRAGGPPILAAYIEIGCNRPERVAAILAPLVAREPPDAEAVVLSLMTSLAAEPPAPERLAAARSLVGRLARPDASGFADLAAGRLRLAERDLAGAETLLRAAAAARPDDALAAFLLGETLYRANRKEEALAEMRRAVLLRSPFRAILSIVAVRLVAVSRETPDPDRAESLAREAMRIDSLSFPATLRTFELLRGRGAHAEASELAEKAVTSGTFSAENLLLLRRLALLTRLLAGDVRAAEAHLDSLPAEFRDSPDGRVVRGFVELGARRLDEARRLFEAVRRDAPDNPAAVSGLVQVAAKSGDREAAARAVAGWSDAHPEDSGVPLAASRALTREGRLDDGLRILTDRLAARPGDRAVRLERASVLQALGRGAEAVESVRAWSEPAAEPAMRLFAAVVAVRCGVGVAEAEATAAALAADAGIDGEIRDAAAVLRCEALAALGRRDGAEAAARAVVDRLAAAPLRTPAARRLEARARFVAGLAAAESVPPRRAAAVAEFVRCTELEPDDLPMLNALAWVLAEDRETAARGLERARALTDRGPGEPSYWDTRAFAAARAGDAAEADRSWQRALELISASPRPDAPRRARIALRYGAFLRDASREAAARDVVTAARVGLDDPALTAAIAAFLAR